MRNVPLQNILTALENCLARVRIEEVNLVCVHVQRYAAANVRS